MTSILKINNDVINRYNILSVESTKFLFEEHNVRYSSILQYVYYKISQNRELLWESNPQRLRILFNRITNTDYRNTTRNIIEKVITDCISKDKEFRQTVRILSDDRRGFYYITNQNNLWGINEEGFGYNFIGLAYSKSISRMFSSFYVISQDTIAMIYKSAQYLIQHLQNGHDIVEFVGKPTQEIYDSLHTMYGNIVNTPPDSKLWESFLSNHKNIYEHEQLKWVQLEIDYPCNLAGFIMGTYIRYFNFYLRTRFHKVMISAYFKYLIETKYSTHTTKEDIQFHIDRMMRRMSTSYHEKLANKLFYLYNDPETTSKLDEFLDYDTRKTLYDIETQFKSQNEIEQREAFTPFLYNAPKEQSMFIYNSQEEFYDLFEPYTTQLSPFTPHLFLEPRLSIMQMIFTDLISYYGNISVDKVFEHLKINPLETSYSVFQDVLNNVTATRKRYFVRKAVQLRTDQNKILKFSVFNTTLFKDDVVVTDPDQIIEETATKELLKIRGSLNEPYYPITLYFSDNIYLQDRIRFRVEDFYRVLNSYKKLNNSDVLNQVEFSNFESNFYQDPKMLFTMNNTNNPIKVFEEYFSPIVDHSVSKRLWSFIGNYGKQYEKFEHEVDTPTNQNVARKQNLYRIIAHVTNTVFKMVPNATFKILSEFLMGLLNIHSSFPTIHIYSTQLPVHLEYHYDGMKNYLDFSSIPADVGFYLLHFVEWVENQNVPVYRIQFLMSIHKMINTVTPSVYSFENSLKPFVTHNNNNIVKAKLAKTTTKTSEKTKNKKEHLKTLMAVNNIEQENEDDNTEEEEGISEMLEELGLDDDDDDDVVDESDGGEENDE